MIPSILRMFGFFTWPYIPILTKDAPKIAKTKEDGPGPVPALKYGFFSLEMNRNINITLLEHTIRVLLTHRNEERLS